MMKTRHKIKQIIYTQVEMDIKQRMFVSCDYTDSHKVYEMVV